MNEQMDIFNNSQSESNSNIKKNSKDKESPDNNDNEKSQDNNQENDEENGRWNSYKVTKTRKSLHSIGDMLSSRYNWVTNSMVPYAGSNVINVEYNLDYDTIQSLYDQDRILTYQSDDTFTTWINKSVSKKRKTKKSH